MRLYPSNLTRVTSAVKWIWRAQPVSAVTEIAEPRYFAYLINLIII